MLSSSASSNIKAGKTRHLKPVDVAPTATRQTSGSLVFLPLLFYAFFFQVLPRPKVWLGACLAISSCSLVGHFVSRRRFLDRRLGGELTWLAFLACFLLSSFGYGTANMTLAVLYVCLIVGMFIVAGETGWIDGCLKAIVLFAAFHAACTILFWLFPVLYPPVKQLFFAGNYMAYGYKSGLTNHYSTNAMYLSIGFVCSACRLLADKGKAHAGARLVLLSIGFALLLTTKRGPLIAAIAGVVMVYMLVSNKRFVASLLKLALALVAASLALYAISRVVPGIAATIARLFAMLSDDTMGGRQGLYEHALLLFGENPVFGSGWGTYQKTFASTSLGAMYARLGFTSMSAHNVYLQLLAETGVVGLGLFLLAVVTTFACGCKTAIDLLHQDEYNLAGAQTSSVGVQAFFLVYCISGNPLYDLQCYIPYFMACCITFALAARLGDLKYEECGKLGGTDVAVPTTGVGVGRGRRWNQRV